jgi:hypothetical protein
MGRSSKDVTVFSEGRSKICTIATCPEKLRLLKRKITIIFTTEQFSTVSKLALDEAHKD